jgi:hypothetical protein
VIVNSKQAHVQNKERIWGYFEPDLIENKELEPTLWMYHSWGQTHRIYKNEEDHFETVVDSDGVIWGLKHRARGAKFISHELCGEEMKTEILCEIGY